MKKEALISLLLLILICIGCGGTKSNNKTTQEPISEINNKMARDTIVIDSRNQKEYKIKIGQLLSYTYSSQPSIGLTGDYKIDNTEVIKILDKKHEFKNPEIAHLDGGDDASETIIFEAIKTGTCSLKIWEDYRGEKQNEATVKIIVE
jgi:hypothetical protein